MNTLLLRGVLEQLVILALQVMELIAQILFHFVLDFKQLGLGAPGIESINDEVFLLDECLEHDLLQVGIGDRQY